MGLLVIIFLVWFTGWARTHNIDGHFAFAVRAVLYPPRATGMHLFFACIGAIWLYLALPLTLLAGLGRRAAAREMTQHRLRTAFWFCLPFLLWIGLLVAAGIKHQLFAQDFGLRDFFFGRFSSAWSGLCFLWPRRHPPPAGNVRRPSALWLLAAGHCYHRRYLDNDGLDCCHALTASIHSRTPDVSLP